MNFHEFIVIKYSRLKTFLKLLKCRQEENKYNSHLDNTLVGVPKSQAIERHYELALRSEEDTSGL